MIGRVIDKYKIVEEVGQGGMSVVYKGLDTSLHREVAVKVLHPHLAGSDEARLRFEREAHAVAKLRHENILEIYDYSGRESADSYIVTELIKGRTLRAFAADHPIAYPEIAAMIVVEVCRALSHAHTLGVLHRDVKPENVMIREDGVLKLMDFGIAQIVDSHRMTITGQLLGSPAYMSPEHIEGRPLDFRTDVFSVGILLYQLATNELPFKGRNPHEILKRIAECRYLDARVVNPLVADGLNRIIMRALARESDDRYQDVSAMLEELQRYLVEVDLPDPRSELKRFFARPLPYEQSLRERLVVALTRAGKQELEAKKTARALEMWNHVLTLDPANDEVLKLIDRLSRRRRLRATVLGAASVLIVGAGGVLAYRNLHRVEVTSPPVEDRAVVIVPTSPDAAALVVASPDAAPAVVVAVAEPDAAPPTEVAVVPDEVRARPRSSEHKPDLPRPTPGIGSQRIFHLVPNPKNAMFSVDGGEWKEVSMGSVDIELGPGSHKILLRHPLCEDKTVTIGASEVGRSVQERLAFKPTRIRVSCPKASAITVNGRPADNNSVLDIMFTDKPREKVTVEFTVGDGPIQTKVETVTAADPTREVKCDGA